MSRGAGRGSTKRFDGRLTAPAEFEPQLWAVADALRGGASLHCNIYARAA